MAGVCGVCGTPTRLRVDDTLHRHGPHDARCPGSGTDPVRLVPMAEALAARGRMTTARMRARRGTAYERAMARATREAARRYRVEHPELWRELRDSFVAPVRARTPRQRDPLPTEGDDLL